MNNNTPNTNNNNMSTAQLWIGSPEHLAQKTLAYLQQQLCPTQACGQCIICKQVQAKQHHHLLWLQPEKQYTLEQLEPLFETIAFDNQNDEPFFLILEHAQLLTGACANRLLKALEEPPAGYFFILLANQAQAIIPTIRSRCIITHHDSEPTANTHPLFTFFNEQPHDPIIFLQTLDANLPNEHESIALIEQLLSYWYEKTLKNPAKTNIPQINILQTALTQPPMPGSSKIFWRNLFLKWHP